MQLGRLITIVLFNLPTSVLFSLFCRQCSYSLLKMLFDGSVCFCCKSLEQGHCIVLFTSTRHVLPRCSGEAGTSLSDPFIVQSCCLCVSIILIGPWLLAPNRDTSFSPCPLWINWSRYMNVVSIIKALSLFSLLHCCKLNLCIEAHFSHIYLLQVFKHQYVCQLLCYYSCVMVLSHIFGVIRFNACCPDRIDSLHSESI